MFSAEQVMQFLPEKQVDKMLTSTDMDIEQAKKQLASVKPQILAFMLESVMGKTIEELQSGEGAQELSKQTGVKDGKPMITSYDMSGNLIMTELQYTNGLLTSLKISLEMRFWQCLNKPKGIL